MSEKRIKREPELSQEEQIFWDRVVRTRSPLCLDIRETPHGCARLLTDYADELVLERRKRSARR